MFWDVKVVVNDIDGNFTNLYMVIRDRPSDFVNVVMKLPYFKVVFKQELMSADSMSDLRRWMIHYVDVKMVGRRIVRVTALQ